jgi:hypothetical protein
MGVGIGGKGLAAETRGGAETGEDGVRDLRFEISEAQTENEIEQKQSKETKEQRVCG